MEAVPALQNDAGALGDESVTVIIPVYNGAHFVAKAIESVLSQTRRPEEILVIDDGSTDNIKEVVSRYANAVTLVSQSNGGLSNARNTGIRLARGKYIALLDADDWWEPRKLEAQLAVMRAHPEASVNYTWLRMVDADTGVVTISETMGPDQLAEELKRSNPGVAPSSVLIKGKALDDVGLFNEKVRACEDWDMWFRLTQTGHRFTVTPEPLTNYLVSASGMSGNADYMYDTFLKLLDEPLLAGRQGVARAIWRRKLLSYQAYKAVLTARGEGKKARERAYVWMSLKAWPSPFWAPQRFKAFAVTLLRSR